jgi:peptidoglycan/xylan/chitin deacetylase (PgdA/CDA1 family)
MYPVNGRQLIFREKMNIKALSVRMSLDTVHHQLQLRFPNALWQGNPNRHEVALTFDDGPDPAATSQLLTLLDAYRVKATFFHIGQRAANSPATVQEVAEAGHQVGVHGYVHESFVLKRSSTLCAELTLAQHMLADASGRPPSAITAVRPPYGHFTPSILKSLAGWGFQPVMWTVVPFHWLQSAAITIRQVKDGASNGAIVVLHETLPGPPVVELAAAILPMLVNDGYSFVTIDDLIAKRDKAGII